MKKGFTCSVKYFVIGCCFYLQGMSLLRHFLKVSEIPSLFLLVTLMKKGHTILSNALGNIRKKFAFAVVVTIIAFNWWIELEKEHVVRMTSSNDSIAYLARVLSYSFGRGYYWCANSTSCAWRSKLSVDSSNINPGIQ